MKLKRAIQITIALRDSVEDPRLKRALTYVLNDDINRALDEFECDFSSPNSFPNFFIIEMVYNNLKSDCEGIKLIEKVPNLIKQENLQVRCNNALERYQYFFTKLRKGCKPFEPIEYYIHSLCGYRWITHVDQFTINFYYSIHKKLDFYEIKNHNSMNN